MEDEVKVEKSPKLIAAENKAAKARERVKKYEKEAANLARLLKARNAKEERTKDNQRKYLLGAMALSRAEKFPDYKAKMLADLDKYLTKNTDRALFDLPPLQEQEKTKTSEKADS